jgi:hypothetical protein
MHFHFPFTTGDVLWTFIFAAHLVLLVVLLGRDRAGRFPIFTAGIAVTAFRLLTVKLLSNRLPQITFIEFMLITLTVSVVLSLLVLLELARKAFGTVQRGAWIAGALAVMIVGAVVIWKWGQWPPLDALKTGSPWQLVQLIVQKGSRLADIETILVGLLIITLGSRFGAGWRTHTQRIVIGLSTVSIAQIGLQATWESIVHHVRANPSMIRSMADQQRIIGLGDKLTNANSVIFIAALVWWILTLWIDEPGAAKAATTDGAVTESVVEPAALESSTAAVLEGPENLDGQ